MNFHQLRIALASALLAICSFGAVQAQTVTVNNASCPNAKVTLGAGTISIDTAGCGTTSTLAAPLFTSGAPTATGNVGAAYSFNFTASGNPAPTFALVTANTLPPGLSLASNGSLTGTPNMQGSYNFAVRASNSQGFADSTATTHSIVISNTPAITSSATLSATLNAAYTYQVVASQTITTGGWSVSMGTLPMGLTLNQNTGLLSGSPSVLGPSMFTISAMNANGTATQAVTFNVVPAGVAPIIAVLNIPLTGTVGNSYAAQSFTTTAGTAPITWSVAAGGTLPTGLALNPSTGVLSGTPTAAGSFTFAVQASNGTLPNAVTAPNYTIVIGSGSSCLTATDGTPIPCPVSKAAKMNGTYHAGANGAGSTINAYSVSPSRCNNSATNTTPPIVTLWHHYIDFADYARKVTNDYVNFGPNEALVYQFTADAANIGAGSIYVTIGPYGTPSPTFVSVSTTPCDFDTTKVNVDSCYSSGPSDTGLTYEITNGSTIYGGCKLVPGTTYYLNLRWKDARPNGSPLLDACATIGGTSCGANMGIKKF